MRYIDSGTRSAEQALGYWLERVLTADITELRWQSAYFFIEGAGLFIPTLERLRRDEKTVRAIVGANLRTTLRNDIVWLVDAIGIPRESGALGVVSFAGGLYHPKTYHVKRKDGSEAAYVGSANLTYPGVSGRNIEAGLVVDTRDGDSEEVLNSISAAIDFWFTGDREGFYPIVDLAAVAALHAAGILVDALPPRSDVPAEAAGGEVSAEITGDENDALGGTPTVGTRASLAPLVTLPRVRARAPRQSTATTPQSASRGAQAVPRAGFPEHFLFAPTATQPTAGREALSGATLPSGAVGLIVRLNRDSARHFQGRSGTANMSIPVSTLSTIRFGIYSGRHVRPRAEFDLHVRYVPRSGNNIIAGVMSTAIMAYGYAADEVGHKDIRLLVPAGVRELNRKIAEAGHTVPDVDDLALLEWPTDGRADFRLTYLEQGSAEERAASSAFAAAQRNGELVGHASWLPAGLSPAW